MLLKFKPTTPGLRGTVLVSKKELSKEKPHKSLTKKFKSTGGRNNQGRITSRRMGGGVKRKYRVRLLIRGPKTLKLQNSLASSISTYKFPSGIKLSVDVDPISFN